MTRHTGLPLFRLALHRRRRMLLALVVGMALFETLIVVITSAVPPEQLFGGSTHPPSPLKAFSGSSGGVSLASYPGLLGAGLVHPFWIAMQLTAVGSPAAAAVAADVEAGTIELLMTRPVSRTRLLGERAAAVGCAGLLLNAVATAVVACGVTVSPDLHDAVPMRGVLAAGLLGCAFTFAVAGPALAVSAAARRKAVVVGAVVAAGAVGFAVNFAALAWPPLEPLRYASPFHYYTPGDALATGAMPWTSFAVLTATGGMGLAAAFRLVTRRDLAP